jgi:hypothetical protein
MPNKQVIAGGSYNALSTTDAQYVSLGSRNTPTTDLHDAYFLFACAGKIKNMYVSLDAPPNGATKTRTFTLYKTVTGDTTLTVTLTDAETTGSDLTHTITVVAGDMFCWHSTVANTPDAAKVAIGFEFYHKPEGAV